MTFNNVIVFSGCDYCVCIALAMYMLFYHNSKFDQICQKRSYTCTASRHTFHCHLLATLMHKQHMCLILPKVEQSAFTQASSASLSGIHKCLGGL